MSKSQKKLLDRLFKGVKAEKVKNVVDLGAGRTSVHYLANKFKNLTVKAIVYPGDERKIKPILECVPEKNYEIVESDIKDLKIKRVDLVLAHLFLGETEKFGDNKFSEILDQLFSIKTKYLIVVNLFRDQVIEYRLFLKYVAKKAKGIEVAYQLSEQGDECLGFLIKF